MVALLSALVAYLTQSCSVLAVTAGKARSTITQTTHTITTIDSVSTNFIR